MKILVIYQSRTTFIEKDVNILKSRHDVRETLFIGPFAPLRILKDIFWCDVVFCWFGKLNAFFAILFAKALGKKTIVVSGGDDVASVPEIGYGMFSFWWKKWVPLFVFRHADLILCVSEANRHETINNTAACPEKVKLLYHGFDPQKWQRTKEVKKENMVITVARVTSETLQKKGLNLFVQAAKYLPLVPFILIGPSSDNSLAELKNIAPPNVTFKQGMYGDDLNYELSRAKIYVQVSIHESFGCSLAEAMLCECIPVVSNKAAIPEVAGDAAIYVDELTPQNIANKIKYVLNMPEDYGINARSHIVNLFQLENRREQILKYIEELVCTTERIGS